MQLEEELDAVIRSMPADKVKEIVAAAKPGVQQIYASAEPEDDCNVVAERICTYLLSRFRE